MAKFIVIDGLDGCGKATQVDLLAEYYLNKGYKVHKLTFPAYDSDSSALVKMYLNGEFGSDPIKLNPYVISSFYAVDRFAQFNTKYFKYFEENDNTVILADRYLSANIIYQAPKIIRLTEKADFIKWVYDYECRLCKLPKEDMTIVLTIPPSISEKLIMERYNGDSSKKDIHESNLDYLCECYNDLKTAVDYINGAHIANWKWFDCSDKDNIKSREEITKMIVKEIDTLFI